MKTIILTENQLKNIVGIIAEEIYQMPHNQHPTAKKANKPYCINPENVKIVKKFLDVNFKKANIVNVGANGLQNTMKIVGLVDNTSGNILKTMELCDLKDQLVTQFQNMFTDKIERELFMDRVVNDWYDDKISPLGFLSVNHL